MQVRCRKHEEYMKEYLDNTRIIPYCATCIAEKRVLEKQQIKERNKPTALEKAGGWIATFIGLILILVGVGMAGATIGFIAAMIVYAIFEVFMDTKTLTSYENTIYISCISFFIFIILILGVIGIIRARREKKLKESIDPLEAELKSLEESVTTHQKRVDDYKAYLLNQYLYTTANIDQVDDLGGIDFEDFMASFFRRTGYHVSKTPVTGDEGLDLIIEKNGSRIGVQCKRYTGKISVSAVQEAYAGKDMHDCNEAMVVTNSVFTAPAIKMAEKLNVALWDRSTLVSELLQVQTAGVAWNDYVKDYYDLKKVNQVAI